MQISAWFPTRDIGTDPAQVRDWAQAAEGLGYDHIEVPDHVFGATARDGWSPLYTEQDPFHETFVTLGYLAGVTTTIGLASGVLILPQRQTGVVAKQAAQVDILSGGRFLFLRHVGKFDMDSVLNKIKYLAKAEDCGVIVLDHISILVGMAMGVGNDERKAIDAVMHNLRAVVEETGVSLIAISHLSKTGASRDSHEEGGRVRLGDLRGSNAIAQLSNIAIALEGNRQADDPEERNMTVVRILKNRFSGETGIAGYLKYDSQTGRLNEVDEYNCGEVL